MTMPGRHRKFFKHGQALRSHTGLFQQNRLVDLLDLKVNCNHISGRLKKI